MFKHLYFFIVFYYSFSFLSSYHIFTYFLYKINYYDNRLIVREEDSLLKQKVIDLEMKFNVFDKKEFIIHKTALLINQHCVSTPYIEMRFAFFKSAENYSKFITEYDQFYVKYTNFISDFSKPYMNPSRYSNLMDQYIVLNENLIQLNNKLNIYALDLKKSINIIRFYDSNVLFVPRFKGISPEDLRNIYDKLISFNPCDFNLNDISSLNENEMKLNIFINLLELFKSSYHFDMNKFDEIDSFTAMGEDIYNFILNLFVSRLTTRVSNIEEIVEITSSKDFFFKNSLETQILLKDHLPVLSHFHELNKLMKDSSYNNNIIIEDLPIENIQNNNNIIIEELPVENIQNIENIQPIIEELPVENIQNIENISTSFFKCIRPAINEMILTNKQNINLQNVPLDHFSYLNNHMHILPPIVDNIKQLCNI